MGEIPAPRPQAFSKLLGVFSEETCVSSMREALGEKDFRDAVNSFKQLVFAFDYSGLKGDKREEFLARVEKAGFELVSACVEEGRYRSLIRLQLDADVPETLRNAAKEGIEAASFKAVERYAAGGDYGRLLLLGRIVPSSVWFVEESVRERVKKAVEESLEETCLKAVETAVKKGESDVLHIISKNPKLPERVRMEAVRHLLSSPDKETRVKRNRLISGFKRLAKVFKPGARSPQARQ